MYCIQVMEPEDFYEELREFYINVFDGDNEAMSRLKALKDEGLLDDFEVLPVGEWDYNHKVAQLIDELYENYDFPVNLVDYVYYIHDFTNWCIDEDFREWNKKEVWFDILKMLAENL